MTGYCQRWIAGRLFGAGDNRYFKQSTRCGRPLPCMQHYATTEQEPMQVIPELESEREINRYGFTIATEAEVMEMPRVGTSKRPRGPQLPVPDTEYPPGAPRTRIGRCVYCWRVGPMTWDHVVPQAEGGGNGNNLVNACRSCNQRKGSMSVARFLRLLAREEDEREERA